MARGWYSSSLRLSPCFFLLSVFVLLLSASLRAQTMTLLAPGTGWITHDGRLLLTNDSGAHWKDSTPQASDMPRAATLNIVFFRNPREGWALMSYPVALKNLTPQQEASQKPLLRLFHTEDGGGSWTSTSVTYPPTPEWMQEIIAGPSSLFFGDSAHGWMSIALMGLQKPGRLLATSDGGQTWNWVNSPTRSGSLLFTSLNDGWLISDSSSDELWATHDGSKSWQQVHLKAPSIFGSNMRVTFASMPRFEDKQNGNLAVEYSGPQGTLAQLVIYSTTSGGKSWRPAKQLPVPPRTVYTLTDSKVVLPITTAGQTLATATVSTVGGETLQAPTTVIPNEDVLALSFTDKDNGWAQKANGQLYTTSNGGTSWSEITPPSRKPLGGRT